MERGREEEIDCYCLFVLRLERSKRERTGEVERKECRRQLALRIGIVLLVKIEYSGEDKSGNYVFFLQEFFFFLASLQWPRARLHRIRILMNAYTSFSIHK